MTSFRPADNADTKVEDDSEARGTRENNGAPYDNGAGSLSVEVLNKRLHDQQFYTRSLIESNIDALMTTDTKGIIVDVNQQMVHLTGRTRDELIGAPCRNFFTNPTRADLAITRVLNEERINDFELTVRSFDGTETVVSYNAATLRDRERMVRGVFAAARDVTDSRRLERALLDRNNKLEQANIARADSVRWAKVDLRTPLHAVVEAADALRRGVDGELSASQQLSIEGICMHTEYVLSQLSALISTSTVETRLVEFDFQDVDVPPLLQSPAAGVTQTGEPTLAANPNAVTAVSRAAAEPVVDTASHNSDTSESGSELLLNPVDEKGDALLQHAPQELISEANQDSNLDVQGRDEAVAGLAEPNGRPTALVVEDDDKSAKLVRLLLEADGFQVLAASTGEDALELVRLTPISLITLDVQLPGMNGWKFLLKLHDSPELALIPVVVIAGLADTSLALSRGAAAVLEKPLQRADLQNSLTLLGLRPDRSQVRCIFVVDDDLDTIDWI